MREFLFKRYKKIMTWIGDIMLATKPPTCTGFDIMNAIRLAKPGSIILRQYTYYLDSYLVPGFFSHAGIVTGHNKMVHSVSEGVQEISVIDFVKDCDSFVILEPQYETKFDKDLAVITARGCIGRDYDFFFSDDKDDMYCFELVAYCLTCADIKVEMFTKSFGIWPLKFTKHIYLAESFLKTCEQIYRM